MQDFPIEVKNILSKINSYTNEDAFLINKAFEFAKEAHADKKRYSGEPYVVHPVGTAKNLAVMRADPTTIAAGLLHDTLSDGEATEQDIIKNFGEDIWFLIKKVDEVGKIRYRGEERHAEGLRKLFIATAKDVRVILIRLADRLHNIETLQYVPEQKRKAIALETIEIFAPIANRLGMGQIKGALEDGAFPFAYPEEYNEIKKIHQTKRNEALEKLEKVKRLLLKKMAEENLTHFKSDFRVKHIYSLHKKLQHYEMDINKIYDIMAFRIIVPTVEDCYRVLGIIHNAWKPLPERMKDYIAVPKFNGYRSIHTVIFTGDGGLVEIQIRTDEMHQEAEFGIAAHLAYDESGKPKTGGILSKKLRWIKQLIDWQKNVKGSEEFLESLKTDFFKNRIFVFTPKGDVIELPEEASPIDFAYAIHSGVGNHMAGAKINNKIASFDSMLKNGDIVEIITKEKSRPSHKWFEFVKTALAKKQIRLALGEQTKY